MAGQSLQSAEYDAEFLKELTVSLAKPGDTHHICAEEKGVKNIGPLNPLF